MKLTRLYPILSVDQKDLIREYDYGCVGYQVFEVVAITLPVLDGEFQFNYLHSGFPDHGSIPVTEESGYKVLGVPMGDLEVIFKIDPDAIKFMRDQFGISKGHNQPTVASLEERLALMRPANTKFLRFFITYGMSSVLAATTGVRISPRIYPSLIKIKEARRLNMFRFVIMILFKSLNQNGKKEKVTPCMLYLMVYFLFSLLTLLLFLFM
jgi:hypothetical protein